mmetsp:Transcript_938/g.2760  ORF Transcript_938/g.2760 Transcript_938/m.2760 type:complete len:292 (-) Transcript_938:619-1494(-)
MAAAAAGSAKQQRTARRVGIVGFGKLGQFLAEKIQAQPELGLELAFVWNRTPGSIPDALSELALTNLEDAASRSPDVIIEVAHPSITAKYGKHFLTVCDYVVGSPTAFADEAVEAELRAAAGATADTGVYIPSGALWGANDLQKMDGLGTLKALTITMKKHPGSFKLYDAALAERCESANAPGSGAVEVYRGPVRALCPKAPNNVNTMAAAALAAPTLGFDGVVGVVVADASLAAHIVEVDAIGPGNPPFTIRTVRDNPAKPGAVTGNATYNSFLSSLLRSGGRGSGFHFC